MASRIYLRTPTLADEGEFLARVQASRALHRPWVSAAATPEQFRRYVKHMDQPVNCALFVCVKRTDEIAGVVNVTNIIRGVATTPSPASKGRG